MLSHTPFYYLITHTARVSCVMMIVMIALYSADCVNKTASMVTTTTYLNQNHTHIRQRTFSMFLLLPLSSQTIRTKDAGDNDGNDDIPFTTGTP